MTIDPKYMSKDVNGESISEEEKDWLKNRRIELDPFDKKNWKSAESRDEWRDSLQKASEAMKMAEWRSVKYDETDRKAAIIHVNNRNREEWLRRIGDEGLVFRDIRYSKPYGGFSHKFFPTDGNDPERITYAVVAENKDIADKMEEAELEMDGEERHKVVGELLGFPECCRESFNKYFLQESIKDPMYEITCNTPGVEKIDGDPEKLRVKDPDPMTNVLWRYFGWSFVTHLPCSWSCEKSREVAEIRKKIMKENGYGEAAEKLEEWLNLPTVWTAKSGVMHIKNRHFIGSARSSDYWSKKKIVWKQENKPGGSIV